ncbi:porin family protein [Cupriavidus numazuensis]|nr:porin family protein [Cupriavidus numazuensis]
MQCANRRTRRIWQRAAPLAGGLLLAMLQQAAHGQELLLMGGAHTNPPIHGDDDRSAVYAYSYQQNLTDNWYATYTYLNEGHVSGHHRDGHSAQLWWRWLTPGRQLALSVGAGPYLFFDTTEAQDDGSYRNHHGVALQASAAATWYVSGGPWMVQARFNRTQAWSSFSSNTALLGVGYQLDHGRRDGPFIAGTRTTALTGDELTVFLGARIVNSFESETGFAAAAEYRHGFWRGVEGTISYFSESSSDLVQRRGVAAQAWLNGGFFDDRLTLGVGAGPYYATTLHVRGPDAEASPSRWSALLTLSASYRLSSHWLGRMSWNRVMTGYDRDADLFLAGVGYRF